jgi:glycosyltransferase involved in cell wall biosynthesis
MKILQVNKYYYPRGGADRYFLDLSSALEKAGHEVAVFAMQHPKNEVTPWSRYFVSRISFNEGGKKNKLKTPGRVLYSLEAKRKFTQLIKDFQPDIIHIHNIYHQLSPSILDAAAHAKIPVVMHLHDYKLICPNHALFTEGAYCERCRPQHYLQCLKHRCVKNSLSASALATLEMYLHHSVLKIYEKRVNLFIAPSIFMKNTVGRFGQDEKKIRVIYNPYGQEFSSDNQTKEQTENKNTTDNNQENYFLYFGRLSEEKGLPILVQAAALAGQKVKIAGDGPEEAALQTLAAKLKAPVEFLGLKTAAELKPLIRDSQAVIIPSIWGENMPLSLLETFSLGKPVIASNIGGMPEIVHDKVNGLLCNPGDVKNLAEKMLTISKLDGRALGKNARDAVKDLTPEKNTAAVITVYQELIKKNNQ